jgi:hypothetical protein
MPVARGRDRFVIRIRRGREQGGKRQRDPRRARAAPNAFSSASIAAGQCPRLLPREPRAEVPTRADASAIARRWIEGKGPTDGTTARPRAA